MLCIYHSADHDGKGSAAIVKYAHKECELLGFNYDQEIPYEEIEKHNDILVDDGLKTESSVNFTIKQAVLTITANGSSKIFGEQRI